MTNRFKTRPSSLRLGGERDPSEKTLHILAVSVLATLWKEEFPDGWIGMSEVIAYSRDGSSVLTDTTRQTFYRGREQLEQRVPGLRLEPRTIGRHAKIRIQGDLPRALDDWFHETGAEFIKGDQWDRYVTSCAGPPLTPAEADDRMMATTARALVVQGRTTEALEVIRVALEKPISLRQELALTISWAFAAGRSGDIREFKRAQKRLQELAELDLPAGDLIARLLKARVRVELAYGKYLAGVMGRTRDTDVPWEISQCEQLLKEARRLHAGFSPLDKARLENVSALLTKARGLFAGSPERDTLLADAKHGFLRAFSLAESVEDVYAMGAALYNIGELCYARDRLDRDDASEDDASEALTWFRQSVQLANRLGITRDLYLDHARLADVLSIVASARVRSGVLDGVAELLSECEQLLETVRTRGNRLERKLGRQAALRLQRTSLALVSLTSVSSKPRAQRRAGGGPLKRTK